MTTYAIDFTDPLKDGFAIAPGSFNGPGGTQANTTLRMYGRGALEWGEAVNENFARLAENFASATPPAFPVGGQVWVRQRLYWRAVGTSTIHRHDPDGLVWIDITGLVNGGFGGTNTTPPAPTIGSYWYTGNAPVGNNAFGVPLSPNTLYRFDQAYKQQTPGWMERTVNTTTANPINGTNIPEQSFLTFNKFTNSWIPPQSVAVSGTTPSTNSAGTLWYNTSNGVLYVANTLGVFGPIAMLGGIPNVGELNMNNFKITNLGTPVAATDAAPKSYVDAATGIAGIQTLLDPVYVNVSGDTMTGGLTLPGLTNTGTTINNSANASIEHGTTAVANTPHIDFHSSGNVIDFDVRMIASGGNAVVGNGNLTISAAQLAVSGAIISTGSAAIVQTADRTSGTVWAIYGTSNVFRVWNNSVGDRVTIDISGNVIAAGNVTAFSDKRLKKNVVQISNALEKVKALTGVTFTRIDTHEKGTGLIAQDVEAVLPEAVMTGEQYKSVAYGNMMGLIVEAIKELDEKLNVILGELE